MMRSLIGKPFVRGLVRSQGDRCAAANLAEMTRKMDAQRQGAGGDGGSAHTGTENAGIGVKNGKASHEVQRAPQKVEQRRGSSNPPRFRKGCRKGYALQSRRQMRN